jgi:hypothetical protein
MLFTQQSKLHPGTTYQVKDVSRLFWLIVSGIFWSVVAYYLFQVQDVNAVYSFLNGGVLIGNLTQSWLYVAALGGLILTTLFAVRAVFRFVANFNGVLVDLNEGTVRYPGGGVIRNKFSDQFRAQFLFQSCYRFVTQLDQIRMIEPRNVTVEGESAGAAFVGGAAASLGAATVPQKVRQTYFFLEFNGSFGAVSLSFSSEGKRDEVYSFIRQYERMGVPVLDALKPRTPSSKIQDAKGANYGKNQNAPATNPLTSKLEMLAQLKKSGALSDAEFSAAKRKLGL